MAAYPRTIKRGPLKGRRYATEYAYRQALSRHRGGQTRYERRDAEARRLGYKGYTDRRRTLERLKGKGVTLDRVPKRLRDVLEMELTSYAANNKEHRKRVLTQASAENIGQTDTSVYATFYSAVDALELRR